MNAMMFLALLLVIFAVSLFLDGLKILGIDAAG